MRASILAAIFAVLPIQQALAWGEEGHSIVAEVAQRRLDPAVAAKIKALLLNTNASLASLSSWADDYRAQHAETTKWHFVDIPLEATGYDAARDCKPTDKGDCAVAAIDRETEILRDETKPKADRIAALRFVIHFIGDIHQPLHCAERNGDDGGNGVAVTWSGKHQPVPSFTTNFHRVWDTYLIQEVVFAWGRYVDRLEGDWFANNQASFYATGTVVDWVNECHQQAAKAYAALPADLKLGEAYLDTNLDLLDRQLAVGGIRLAKVLNDALK